MDMDKEQQKAPQDWYEMDDKEVVASVLENKEAFGELIRRYEVALLRYIGRIGILSIEDRKDVLQNIFIKAYRNIQSYDPVFAFSTWIYRIAHNEAVSFFRARKIRPEGNMIDDAEDVLLRMNSDGEEGDSEEISNKSFNAEHLNNALLKLDEKYRNILILRYFEDREYTEISDILQIPPGSVATLIHRAKKQLAKHLEYIKETVH